VGFVVGVVVVVDVARQRGGGRTTLTTLHKNGRQSVTTPSTLPSHVKVHVDDNDNDNACSAAALWLSE
jgi:hypothetical protein